MKTKQLNDEIARTMGLKIKRVIATRVARNEETEELWVSMEVIATKKQSTKLIELLIKNLKEY